MRKIAASWVPHQLTEVQKWNRYALAGIHLKRYRNDGNTFPQRIVIIDLTWVRAYEPELKHQSNELRH
ncbi:mariner Mos1 transposase [Trichonephila clavipes]|nr:mariner Mos1 transposase [Trichonephila clavipes]